MKFLHYNQLFFNVFIPHMAWLVRHRIISKGYTIFQFLRMQKKAQKNDQIRFDVKYNRQMIAPLDPRTMQFYMEMGYSEQQVRRAYDYSIRKQVDILDALALTSQTNPSLPAPPKKPQNSTVQPPPAQKSGFASFLTPLAQIKNSDYETLYSRSNKFNPLNSKNQLREPNNPVGLLNISNCCYLNSLIQCYFLMDKFKEILLTAEPLEDIAQLLADNKTKLKRVKNQYELLGKLKYFFTVMSLTSKKYLDPSEVLQNLVDSVGEKLTYGEEKDLSEINIMIIERLSQGLTFSKKFFKKFEDPLPSRSSFIDEGEDKTRFNSIFNPEKGFIKQLFYGTKVEYYQQAQLQKEQPIVSDFTGIILNPRFGTLQNALDEEFNFSVQINNQSFKKQMYIRDEPQYLFLYINRTQYNRQQQQMHKNDEKFVFDFVLYLDRYLEKYKKERDQKDQRIRKLISDRNRTKEQLSNLHLLFKKMEECFEYAAGLEGWEQKLPTVEDFQADQARLNDRLNEVEHQLKQIQSRKEEYHLMYIFVHRGDAISGHYWGYGRNGTNWYRFDINCRLIPQEQIIIDMQKSTGTPYALLYVKKENIPQCRYNYHTKINMIQDGDLFFYKNFQPRLAEEIVKENIMLHQEMMIKGNQAIKKKCYNDYVNRYNALRRVVKAWARPKEEMGQLDTLPVCNNFSFFLHSKQELQLCKFSIFQQSLLLASGNKINIDRLLTEGDLLGRIQKKFKAKCKGEYHLKNYAMVGKDLEKYIKYQEEYQLSIFQTIWAVSLIAQFQRLLNAVEKLMKPGEFVDIDLEAPIGSFLANIVKFLKTRTSFYHGQEYQRISQRLQEPLYITQVNNEITKLVMLKLVVLGFKFESLQKFVEISDAAGSQIAAINSYNSIAVSFLVEGENALILEEMQQMVKKYLATNSKKQSSQSAVKSERKSSVRQSDSPMKSAALTKLSSNRSKRPSDCRLTAIAQANLLLIDLRQTWKFQQLQTLKPNFELPSLTLSLLRRLSDIVRVYKHSLQHQRILTHQELTDAGIHLNQPKSQESLI